VAILAAAGRIASTVLAMAGTRLELAAVELQEDGRRMVGYVAMAFIAAFLAGVAFLLAALFVIVIFWDTYRLQAVGGMAVLFGALAALLLLWVKSGLSNKPPMLAATLAELRNDVAALRGHVFASETADHEPMRTAQSPLGDHHG
jgi:uncharacterized membrane protein YqjE